MVEETGVPHENHWQTLSHHIVSSTPHHGQDSNSINKNSISLRLLIKQTILQLPLDAS